MLHRLGSHVRNQWMGALSLFLVLTGGIAYAADTIGSADIINESIRSEDVKNQQVRSADIGNNQIFSADVRDDTLANGGLTGADIANQSLTGADIADGSLDGADLGEFRGRGDLDDVNELILAVPALGLQLRTDVDNGVDMQVDIHNVGTSNFQIQFVGQNSATVTPSSSDPVVAPGDFAAFGSDAATLDAVVFKSGVGRVWIQCIFPLDDALCRATFIA